MTLHSRFFLFVLLLTSLQPLRLAASTPDTENFLKYVAEEGGHLLDEVTGEEGSINHLSSPNAVQPTTQAVQERILRTTSSTPIMDTHSIADPTSSFFVAPETTAIIEPPVGFLHGNSIAQVSSTETMPPPVSTGKSLGDRILALPTELISISLRSLETKQTAYKADHQQTVQELQIKYPALAQKITVWKRAVDAWNAISGKADKAAYYQDVVTLTADMPPELYRLVALSKAMKIMEDTTTYTHYLPLALEKYRSDPRNNVYQAFFFQKLDIINNNIKKLENAADAILSLSEQTNRCLAAAATVPTEENNDIEDGDDIADDVNIAEDFQNAARTAEQAVVSYCQFSQQMKEGVPAIAYFSRIKGFSLECNALEQEYRSQHAVNADNEDGTQAMNFLHAAYDAERAAASLEKAAYARRQGKTNIAKVYEQAAQYHFQIAQTVANGNGAETENIAKAAKYLDDAACRFEFRVRPNNEDAVEITADYKKVATYHLQAAHALVKGDSTKVQNFSNAVQYAYYEASELKDATQAKSEGQDEIANAHNQAAEYYSQTAQAAVNGNNTEVEKFSSAAEHAASAARKLKDATQARSEGQQKIANAHEKSAQYCSQAAQAIVNGESTKANNFLSAGYPIYKAVEQLKKAAHVESENQGAVAQAYEQAALYHLLEAQAIADGKNTEAENFSDAAQKVISAEEPLKKAVQAKSEGQDEMEKVHEQVAQYHFKAAQAAVDGDSIKANNFLIASRYTDGVVEPLRKAAQAKSEGQVKVAKTYNQAAQYCFQAAQAIVDGDSTKANNLARASCETSHEASALEDAAQAGSIGQGEVAKAYEQAAQYYSQGAQTAINGDRAQTDNFAQAASHALRAVEPLKKTAQAKSEGQSETANAHEQVAKYRLQAAQAAADGDRTKENAFSNAARWADDAVIEPLKMAAQAKSQGQGEIAEVYEHAAQYYFLAAETLASGNSLDSPKVKNCSDAIRYSNHAAHSLKDAAQAKNEGQVETEAAYKQAAQYHFKAAEVAVNGDSTKTENFSNAAWQTKSAADFLKKAAQAKSEGQIRIVEVYEKAAQYYFQSIQAALDGDNTKVENFSNAAEKIVRATEPLKNAAKARSESQVDAAITYETAAQYYFDAANAVANGDTTQAKNFSKTASYTDDAARKLKNAAQTKNESQVEAATTYKQSAQYYLEAAQFAMNGDSTKAENFSSLANNTSWAAYSLKNAAEAKSSDQVETAIAFDQASQYYFQSVQTSVDGDNTKAENFSQAGRKACEAGEVFKKAAQIRNKNNRPLSTPADTHEVQNTHGAQNLGVQTHQIIQAPEQQGNSLAETEFQRRSNIQEAEYCEQVARYLLRQAEVYAQEGIEKGNAFSRETYDEELKQ